MNEPRINPVPVMLPDVTAATVRDALIDATAEFAKINPANIDMGDLFALAPVYGLLAGIVNRAAERQRS